MLKKRPLVGFFWIASFISALWSGLIASSHRFNLIEANEIQSAEIIKNLAWLTLLAKLISLQSNQPWQYSRIWLSGFAITLGTLLLALTSEPFYWINQNLGTDLRLVVPLVLAIMGLMLIEQAHRNADHDQRWFIKFLLLGLGMLFIIELILYSKSTLFKHLDNDLWLARGVLQILVALLLGISVFRLGQPQIDFRVSREVMFRGTVLIGVGIYLLVMSLAGFFLKQYGGEWGGALEIVFIALAAVVLIVLLMSGSLRAMLKVYLSKNFQHEQYNYRQEWIKLSRAIAPVDNQKELTELIAHSIKKLVESSGAGVWVRQADERYQLQAESHLGFNAPQWFEKNTPFIRFLRQKQWVIDLVEYQKDTEIYDNLDLGDLQEKDKKIWLIIPLTSSQNLEGFVILTQPRLPRILNWEDHDLLKTVALQMTNALVLNRTVDELTQARQFEAYNRLSAYIVHDLKNLLAQIALIVKNAEKHKRNPEFIDDSIETLDHVLNKMRKVIDQLRHGKPESDVKTRVDLGRLLANIGKLCAGQKPEVEVELSPSPCWVQLDGHRFSNIVQHLLDNARQATDTDGWIRLSLMQSQHHAVIELADNGCGMDEAFIAERLFKPFDTTKGNAGMGIGVFQARDYVQKLGGRLTVASQPGHGTTFRIELPLAKVN